MKERMLAPVWSMIQDESASTTLEYALLIAAIAVVAITSVETFGLRLASLFHPSPASAGLWGR
jgi:Flp pilus assembly pilin Flp